MGVVMLHLDQLDPFRLRCLPSQLSGEIIGVQIDRDGFRAKIEQRSIQPQIASVVSKSRRVFQIPHVLREHRPAAFYQAEAVFQFAAHRQ